MATFIDGIITLGIIIVLTIITVVVGGITYALFEKFRKDEDDD